MAFASGSEDFKSGLSTTSISEGSEAQSVHTKDIVPSLDSLMFSVALFR